MFYLTKVLGKKTNCILLWDSSRRIWRTLLWPGVVEPVRVQLMGKIELNFYEGLLVIWSETFVLKLSVLDRITWWIELLMLVAMRENI